MCTWFLWLADTPSVRAGLSLCLWSPCGTYLLAAGFPAVCFVWHWPFADATAAADVAADAPLPASRPPLPRRAWPPLTELCKLYGNGKSISAVKWNRAGTAVAAASSDGTVNIYAPPEADAQAGSDAPGPSGGAALLRRAAGPWRRTAEMRAEPLEGSRARKVELLQVRVCGVRVVLA